MRRIYSAFGMRSLMCAVIAFCSYGCSDKSSEPAPTALVGPTWRLTQVVNIKGVSTDATLEFFSANFTAAGGLSGTASCNSYSATYAVGESGGLAIDSLATTLVYCGEGSLLDQYYAGLRAVHHYELTGTELTLYFAQQGELVFVALGPD